MGELIASDGDFDYRILTPEISDDANALVSRIFTSGEALTSYSNIRYEATIEYNKGIYGPPSSEGLSLVAIHRPTGELCGALLCEKWTRGMPPPWPADIQEIFSDMNVFLEESLENMCEDFGLDPDGMYHQVNLAVDQKWKGNNIGLNLMKFSLDVGRSKGFRFAFTELTSPISQHFCLDKLGYTLIRELVHSEFEIDGRRPYENLPGSTKSAFIALS